MSGGVRERTKFSCAGGGGGHCLYHTDTSPLCAKQRWQQARCRACGSPLELLGLHGSRRLAGDVDLAAAHSPLLLAHLVDKLVMVAHNHNAAAVLLQGGKQGGEGRREGRKRR